MHNRLHIRSPFFEIELRGDERFLTQAYEAISPTLQRYIETTLVERAMDDEESQPIPVPEGPGTQAIQVQICHDLYRRTHAIDRAMLQDAPIARQLMVAEIDTVYIERSVRDRILTAIPLGKPLWSELTSRGADRTRGS